jgi:hypothetical protein
MLAVPHILAQTESTVYNLPPYFTWVFGLLLIAGGPASRRAGSRPPRPA